MITGGGLDAVVVSVSVLFAGFGSNVAELTVAVFVIVAPLSTEQLTWATRVIVAESPAAREVNVTVRLLLEPPHAPPTPPLTEHEVNVVEAGRLSFTITEVAALGPALVT